jgi:CheY-like chemotaxis protein
VKPRLEGLLPSSILKNVSVGLALFGADDFKLEWCNQSFKKQTWFGGAQGGKNAKEVSFFDLFEKKDHPAVVELFNITRSLGQAYDFHRVVRRGPVGSFPAELRFHHHADEESPTRSWVCLEIRDLSLNKQYDALEAAHSSMRERVSDLMAAQAELHYSVRMSTISEIGADMAHSLINPVTMCRDIVVRELAPLLSAPEQKTETEKLLNYLRNIEDLAVWFRKFSNPRLAEMQITNVASLIEDALILNMSRFTKLGVNTQVSRRPGYNPFVLAVPVNLIMWLNAAFAEVSGGLPQGRGLLCIRLDGNADTVLLKVEGELTPGATERLLPHTLEKFAKRLPAGARFVWNITTQKASFELQLACFAENEKEEAAQAQPRRDGGVFSTRNELPLSSKPSESPKPMKEQRVDGQCVLIVDDEKDIRRLLKRTFVNLGVETLEASDGQQALDILTAPENAALAAKVRAVVSDVRMPVMTGIHLFQELHARGVKKLPFIFFSSNIIDAQELGLPPGDPGAGDLGENVHFLTKDSDLDRLKSLVLGILGGAS